MACAALLHAALVAGRHCAPAPPGDKGAELTIRIHLSRKNRRGPDELRGPAGFAAFAKTKADQAVTTTIKKYSLINSPDSNDNL